MLGRSTKINPLQVYSYDFNNHRRVLHPKLAQSKTQFQYRRYTEI